MTLESPSHRFIDATTIATDVHHSANDAGESYVVDNPEAGIWTIWLATDTSIDAIVTASTMPLPGLPCDALDFDDDGVCDTHDNCWSALNADQRNTDAGSTALNRPGTDPLGDACDDEMSGDGYTNDQHVVLGKDPATYCSIMRADVDGDGAVSILDLSRVAQKFGQAVPPASERLRQDADYVISILDLSKMAQKFTQPVTTCP